MSFIISIFSIIFLLSYLFLSVPFLPSHVHRPRPGPPAEAPPGAARDELWLHLPRRGRGSHRSDVIGDVIVLQVLLRRCKADAALQEADQTALEVVERGKVPVGYK